MTASRSERPNILLIVQDSIRARNFSLYGYRRRTTPFLERIAENGIVYRNTISAATSTVPSHGSIFTGTHISSHELFLDKEKLRSDYVTMAELLQEQGYVTSAVCYQDDVSPVTGLHRGFLEFEMHDEPGLVKRTARKILSTKKPLRSVQDGEYALPAHWGRKKKETGLRKRIKDSDLYKRIYWMGTAFADQGAVSSEIKFRRFLDSHDRSKPFFYYLHYDETHLPYRPRVPYRKRFLDGRRAARPFHRVNQDRNSFFLGEVPMDEKDFSVLESLYDGTIGYLDRKTWEVYSYMEKNGWLDNTIFIVLGDHGDNIGEHGLMSHKFCVYDNLVRVPMVIRYPRGMKDPGTVEDIVQTTDLFATVLDALGLQHHPVMEQMEGNSLLSSAIRNREPGLAIAELLKPFGLDIKHRREQLREYDRSLLAARTLEHKYIHASDGRQEFYDLVGDPDESENLIDSGHPGIEPLKGRAAAAIRRFEACYDKYKDRL